MRPATPLNDAIARFDEWAETADHTGAEWAIEYPGWSDIYDVVLHFVDHTPPDRWSNEDLTDLLHALAHDNEAEHLAAELAARPPEVFRAIAQSAHQHGHHDARWQVADRLGRLAPTQDWVEPTLLLFAADVDEYVRRRALASLARIRSPHVETLARGEWDKAGPSQQWARMNVLWCLENIGSPALDNYLRMAAEVDGHSHLFDFAQRIRRDRSSG